jgi:transcriptional regulator with XRE-family HTH domain
LDVLVRRIEAARLERLLSKTALAALAGVSRQRVSELLNGRNRSLSTLRALKFVLWPPEELKPNAPR